MRARRTRDSRSWRAVRPTCSARGARAAPPPAPPRTTLDPPSPNPLTSASVLRFEVERAGKLTLEAFDFAGRRVRTLADGRREAGRYELAWSGDDSAGQRLRPGVYWLRLSGAGRTEVRKVVLMR